jgi:transposase, IS30 family
MDEEAATEADSGRPDCDRSAAERRLGVRAIARKLGRSPSVISTEIGRGREPDGTYAAGPAQAAAAARWDRSGRRARLAPDSPLFAEMAKLLRLQWSPEQIAGRRKRMV